MDTIRPDLILRVRLNRWAHAGADPGTARSAALREDYRALVLEAADAPRSVLAASARAAAMPRDGRHDRVLYNFACEAHRASLMGAA